MFPQQGSYSEFMPLRQSSLLTDDTLLMNDTDVYANVTVIWPAGHRARELELERARIEFEALRNGVPYEPLSDSLAAPVANDLAATLPNCSSLATTLPKSNSLAATLPNSYSLASTLDNTLASTRPNDSMLQNSDDESEETIWMTALDIPYSSESSGSDEESMFETFHTVLDFTLTHKVSITGGNFSDEREKMDSNIDDLGEISLDDTLPMDDEASLPMDDVEDTISIDFSLEIRFD